MDINTLPRAKQEQWLRQRGWDVAENRPGMWADPATGVSYAFFIALKRAISEAKLPADLELDANCPPRKHEQLSSEGGTQVPPLAN